MSAKLPRSRLSPRVSLYVLIPALVAALAGCAQLAQRPTTANDWQTRANALDRFTAISYQARASLTNKEQAFQFSLDWEQRSEQFHGSGYSIIGSKLFDRSGDEHFTYYTAGKEQIETLPSKQVINQFTGLQLSPAELFTLVAALPTTKARQEWKDGRLAKQTLGEVQISYLAWRDFNSLEMPRRVKIVGPDNQLILSFSDWQFSPQGAKGQYTAVNTRKQWRLLANTHISHLE